MEYLSSWMEHQTFINWNINNILQEAFIEVNNKLWTWHILIEHFMYWTIYLWRFKLNICEYNISYCGIKDIICVNTNKPFSNEKGFLFLKLASWFGISVWSFISSWQKARKNYLQESLVAIHFCQKEGFSPNFCNYNY